MNGLTVILPWGLLLALPRTPNTIHGPREKQFETRDYPARYRGWVALHAGRNRDFTHLCEEEPFRSRLAVHGWRSYPQLPAGLPFGQIVGVGRLKECWQVRDEKLHADFRSQPLPTPQEQQFGDFSPGRWAWEFNDVYLLPEPIPCRGAPHLWPVPQNLVQNIRTQVAHLRKRGPPNPS